MSSRYAQVDRCLWVDAKFLGLSSVPSAQLLFLWLLTSPEVGIIPGLVRIGLAGLSEAIGWPPDDVAFRMGELVTAGMAKVDWKSRLVWLPKALARNLPRAPQNMKPWGKAWAEVPECPLKTEAWAGMADTMASCKPEWSDLFAEICAHPGVKQPTASVVTSANASAEAKPPTKPQAKPPAKHRVIDLNSKPSSLTHNHDHNQDHEQEQDQPEAKPRAAAPALRESERAVLDALLAWPSLAPLASAEMVREIRATATPAGWSPDDVLAGIEDLGAKHGLATAASGTLDPGKLAAKLAGFIKSAHSLRRGGGSEASVGTHGGGGGYPRRKEPCSHYGDPTPEEIAKAVGESP